MYGVSNICGTEEITVVTCLDQIIQSWLKTSHILLYKYRTYTTGHKNDTAIQFITLLKSLVALSGKS